MKLFVLFSSIFSMLLASSLLLLGQQPDRLVTYKQPAEGESLQLHVFLPEGHIDTDKRPSVVFFFGGGWVSGSPGHFYAHCRHFASRGIVAISAQYRTEESHGTTPRVCVQDGKSAIRYVREHAESLGVDPELICAGGGSAGGHVALATASLEGFNEPGESTEVSCIPSALLLFNPVIDTSEDGFGYSRVVDYWESFSPYHNVSPEMPPTIAFFGDEDSLISVETAESYRDKVEALGVRFDLHIFEGQGHGFFNQEPYRTETIELADEFMVSLGFLDFSFANVMANHTLDNNQFQLNYSGMYPNYNYTLLSSPDLENWLEVTDLTSTGSGTFNYTEPTSNTPRFFCLKR